jgi:zinc transporter ZupT
MSYFSRKVNSDNEHKHEHEHHHHEHNHVHTNNIALSLLGDFIHNVTDGMAIGAGFNKSLKMGISLSLSIFFHEIPHEVGDFSYLLKQNMKISSALSSQLFSALGSFVGVYLSFWIGELYSNQIISFASGAFLYLALNTIMSDLKSSSSLIQIICEVFAYILGVIMLLYIM